MHVRWDSVQKVQVTTLDRLNAQKGLPRYTKIDVEGHELQHTAGPSWQMEYIFFEDLPALSDLTLSAIGRLVELETYQFNPVRDEAGVFLWSTRLWAKATKAWLHSVPATSASGDIYTRLPGKPD